MGKKFAFKIDVADYNIEREWYVYTVVKMTDDKHVIGELLKKVLNNEVHMYYKQLDVVAI